MAKPLTKWEDEQPTHPNLVWRAKLDNRFLVEVHRVDSDTGTLYIFDHKDGDKEIYSKPTTLMYGSPFGPGIEQILKWPELVVNTIDYPPQVPK